MYEYREQMYSVGLAASVEATAWLELLLTDAARVLVDPACVPFSICMPDALHMMLEKSPHAINNCVKTYIPRIRIYKSQFLSISNATDPC